MLPRRYKRKSAYALSRQLRLRFYKGAATATLVYVTLTLVRFHGQYAYLPYELALIWAVFLMCYTSFKELIRWSDVDDSRDYHGELWAGVILAGAAWMILWNIGREWIFHLKEIPFPEDYQTAVIETIVLYTLSSISSFLHRYHHATGHAQKTYMKKVVHRGPKSPVIVKANPATATPVENQKVEVVLTKAPPYDENNPPKLIK